MDPISQPPIGITVQAEGITTRFVRKWSVSEGVLSLLFAGIWNGGLTFGYHQMLSEERPDFFALWFCLIFVAIGIYLVYGAIACITNRSILDLGKGLLTVRHKPLPWRGSRTIETRAIKRLSCQGITNMNHGARRVARWLLVADMADGKSLIVLQAARLERAQAIYLAQEIGRRLGIPAESDVKAWTGRSASASA